MNGSALAEFIGLVAYGGVKGAPASAAPESAGATDFSPLLCATDFFKYTVALCSSYTLVMLAL